MSLVGFHKELCVVLTSYYEDIVKMDGAGGLDRKVAYKRPVKRLEVPPPSAGEGAAAEANGRAADAEVANASEQAPAPAETAEPAAAPAKRAARKGKAWTLGSAGLLARDLACSQFLETASI